MVSKRTSDVLDDDSTAIAGDEPTSHSVSVYSQRANQKSVKRARHHDEVDAELEDDASSSHAGESRSYQRMTQCAEAGVIESVSLVDFMCHQNLSIDLGSNMNFIIGHNGSGKSAILTAITVCLGGKAAISGRGSSIKNLVRNGQTQATVTVRLRNRGPDAYQPDVYGNCIIVERKINAEGGGTYTIKDQHRSKRSNRKEDLEAITDHFGLAIENPMNVLSQDTARQFLSNATPKTLYDLFMKGIELQQLEIDHGLLSQNIETTSATLTQRASNLDKLREQEAEATRIYDETSRARETEKEVETLENQMAWVQVRDIEMVRDNHTKRLERERTNVETITSKLEINAREESELQEKIISDQDKIKTTAEKEQKPILDRQQVHQLNYEAAKAEVFRLMTEARECQSQIKRQDTTIEVTKASIVREKELLAANETGIAQRRRALRKEELDEEIGRAQEELDDIDAQYHDAGIDQEKKQTDLRDAQQAIEEADREESQVHDQISRLREVAENSLAAFHPNMHKLLKAIEQNDKQGRWKEKPIGPLGRTMHLKHPKWSDIIENFWGKNINGFLVSTFEDKNLLLKLIRQEGVNNCPVLKGADREFVPNEPDAEYLTILRAIDWQNDRVKRQLIITNRPEGHLLISSRQEAELTMDPLNPPRNAIRAFALDPQDARRGFMIGGGPRGSSNQSIVNPYKNAKRLTTDTEADMAALQDALARAKENTRSKKEIHRLLVAAMKQITATRSALHNRRAELISSQQKRKKELDKIREELEIDQDIDDGALRGYEEALETAQAQKELYVNQYRGIIAAKAQATEKQTSQKAILEAIETELEDFDSKIKKLEPHLLQLKTDLQVCLEQRSHFTRQLSERQDKVHEIELRLSSAQANVDEQLELASQICPRVEIDENETAERLEKRLDDKKKAILRITSRYGGVSSDDIRMRLLEARENLATATSEVEDLQVLVTELSAALEVRLESRRAFQRYICMRAKNNFVRHLSERDFAGKLVFDHKKRELHTHVTPADVKVNLKGKDKKRPTDNKVLSGGEKSFTTICLLLSIWEAMGCPIRALDEFDVFMDSVNRGISMRMMIDSANDSVDKQFIVITPLDMGGVKPTATTKIHRLKDPVRGVGRPIASQG